MSGYLGYSSRSAETSAAISRIQARHKPPPSNQPAAPLSCPDPKDVALKSLEPMSSAAPPKAAPAEDAEKPVSKFADKPWKGQAKKFARNMLLQYAMFKVLGPDKWRFAGFYHPRNAAYHSVINAKAAGITVLDIGAGTGELAMVASRAGAENVVTLEGTKPASRLVAKVCGANKIKNVLPCHDEIETMEVGEDEDLEEPAALVTMQVTDVALFGTALARLAEVVAHPQMVAPGAQFVPSRARVFVAAVEAFPSRAAVEQPVRCIPLLALHPSACAASLCLGAVPWWVSGMGSEWIRCVRLQCAPNQRIAMCPAQQHAAQIDLSSHSNIRARL